MNGELISCNCTHTLIYTTFKNQFLQVRSFEISTSLPSAALQTSHLVLKLAENPRSVMLVQAHRGACSSRAVCTSPRRQSGSHVTVISVFLMDLTQGRGHSLVSPSSTPLIWSRLVSDQEWSEFFLLPRVSWRLRGFLEAAECSAQRLGPSSGR